MAEIVSGVSHKERTAKAVASRRAGRAETAAKWPAEVAVVRKGVMQGYRQLILSDGKGFRIFWRSLKGVGFWITAKGQPVCFGKTLNEATERLAHAVEFPSWPTAGRVRP